MTISGVDATGNGLKTVMEQAGTDIQFSAGAMVMSNCEQSLEYLWDFGDGSGASVADPVHAYTLEGKYTVNLTVKCPACNKAMVVSSVQVEIECARLVNFRIKNAGPNNLSLQFDYEFDSSTGDLNDLGRCELFERVDYPDGRNPWPWPDPPWVTSSVNPTVLSFPATGGILQDTHDPGMIPSPQSLTAASFSARQKYYYKCSCLQNPQTERILQSGIVIVREIYMTTGGSWRMKIVKDGYMNDFQLVP